MIFLGYSKCSTCTKAKKIAVLNGCDLVDIMNDEFVNALDIVLGIHSTVDDLINVKSRTYRELKLKDTIKSLNYEEKVKLLKANPKLMKRPILVDIENDFILIGFDEIKWSEYLNV